MNLEGHAKTVAYPRTNLEGLAVKVAYPYTKLRGHTTSGILDVYFIYKKVYVFRKNTANLVYSRQEKTLKKLFLNRK